MTDIDPLITAHADAGSDAADEYEAAGKVEVIIVNDGAYTWGADRETLEAAMKRLGWTKEYTAGGVLWIEPEADEDDEDGGEYTRLCHAVPPLTGYAPEDERTDEWDDHPHLTARPDRLGVWELFE